MDVALSDVLTCPRCGPGYGLIVRPDEVRDRRVRSGVLGCANCRERYEVVEGVARLAVGGAAERRDALEAPDRDAAVRLAALLGLGEGGGTVVVAGPGSGQAELLSELVPEVRVVVDRGAGGGQVSAMEVGDVLPVRSGSLRGVALTGDRVGLIGEGARAVGAGGRLVVDPAPPSARSVLESAGLDVLLEEGDVVVAGRAAGRGAIGPW